MIETPVRESNPLNCHECEGNCCQYFALQLDTPDEPDDFDNLRWYLAHQNIIIFIENGDWYLQMNNPCRFLTPQHTCEIYEQRPKICRDYGLADEECHGTDRPCDHEEIFTSLQELEEYLTRKGMRWASAAQPART